MNKNWCLAISMLFAGQLVMGQEQDADKGGLKINGYIESYYQFNPDKPKDHIKAPFFYSHGQVNEIAVNLAMLKASYEKDIVRSTIALGVGSYMNSNYAGEKGMWQHVIEANVGVKLAKSANLWLDAGVLPSHIGPESAIGSDNISLTRSLAAENSPYFETGARLSYTSDDEKWYLAAVALNGWQRIQLTEDQQGLSVGHQITYKPVSNLTLNSSSYLGEEGKDRLRFFHDFYVQWQSNIGLELLGSFDYGQQHRPEQDDLGKWWNTGLQARYWLSPTISVQARGEYFHDKDGMIFGSDEPSAQEIWGSSAGLDISPILGLVWRLEYRYLDSKGDVFQTHSGSFKPTNHGITTSLAWKF